MLGIAPTHPPVSLAMVVQYFSPPPPLFTPPFETLLMLFVIYSYKNQHCVTFYCLIVSKT